jgi:putative ATPase
MVQKKQKTAPAPTGPLANRVRPSSPTDFVGQANAIVFLSTFLEPKSFLPSLIIWGPPGCGKTTYIKLIARMRSEDFLFKSCSAVSTGAPELKKILTAAERDAVSWKRQTCLFVDEIHRLNKMQQDVLLPHVEDGGVILLGATTENPSFSLNTAVLSRCKVVKFSALETEQVVKILARALADQSGFGGEIVIEEKILWKIAQISDGDVRSALNHLELVANLVRSGRNSDEIIAELMQKQHLKYDRNGDEHYDLISALHKSMRGGDANAAIYWACRQLESGEKPEYLVRRMMVFASEDIGMADSNALLMATSTLTVCKEVGYPECRLAVCHLATYLSLAPKSIAVYMGMKKALERIKNHPNEGPPMNIRNAPTKLMSNLGYGAGYVYTPAAEDEALARAQNYLPDSMKGMEPFLDLSQLEARRDWGQKWKK